MMLAFLAAVAAQGSQPVIISPTPPPACQGAEEAMRDQFATMNVREVPSRPGPGPLGKEYLKASDRLSRAMREKQPDLRRIETLWRELDGLKLEIGKRVLANTTQCTLQRLAQMPLAEQQAALRRIAPPTQEEIRRGQLEGPRPVAPPTASPAAPKQ